ncbi:MAG: GNAT family N-acetyltransferase [Fimbriimonadaceae bacterium]|nr:GNAT family N-acetyltransferase [Fimbriimonadaceae bacterium]
MPSSTRPACADDAATCASITATGRNADDFLVAFESGKEAWVVLESADHEVIGVGGCQLWQWNQVAWVMDLTIRRDRRGHGQGRLLLEALLGAAKLRGALVLMDFEPQGGPLIEFYLQSGFRICGFNDRYLPGNEDPSVVFLSRDL